MEVVGPDIFVTIYLVYSPFAYKFFVILTSDMYKLCSQGFLQRFIVHGVFLKHCGNFGSCLIIYW